MQLTEVVISGTAFIPSTVSMPSHTKLYKIAALQLSSWETKSLSD